VVFGGLSPQNKAPSPHKLNMKHYKSVKFLSIFGMSGPPGLNKLEAPLLKAFWRRFWGASNLFLAPGAIEPRYAPPQIFRSVDNRFLLFALFSGEN